MKLIYNKSGIAPLYMEDLRIIKNIDVESVRIEVPFVIGENELQHSNRFIVTGTLNIPHNWFHWDSDNKESLMPYFDGYDINLEEAIERR